MAGAVLNGSVSRHLATSAQAAHCVDMVDETCVDQRW